MEYFFYKWKNFNKQNFLKFIGSIEQKDTLDKKGLDKDFAVIQQAILKFLSSCYRFSFIDRSIIDLIIIKFDMSVF